MMISGRPPCQARSAAVRRTIVAQVEVSKIPGAMAPIRRAKLAIFSVGMSGKVVQEVCRSVRKRSCSSAWLGDEVASARGRRLGLALPDEMSVKDRKERESFDGIPVACSRWGPQEVG